MYRMSVSYGPYSIDEFLISHLSTELFSMVSEIQIPASKYLLKYLTL